MPDKNSPAEHNGSHKAVIPFGGGVAGSDNHNTAFLHRVFSFNQSPKAGCFVLNSYGQNLRAARHLNGLLMDDDEWVFVDCFHKERVAAGSNQAAFMEDEERMPPLGFFDLRFHDG